MLEDWIASDGEDECNAVNMAVMTKASINEAKRKESAGLLGRDVVWALCEDHQSHPEATMTLSTQCFLNPLAVIMLVIPHLATR